MNVNTKVRECISELEKALEDEELIVDQHLLERFSSLAHRLSHIRKQGPKDCDRQDIQGNGRFVTLVNL